jgi:hypothetical protein
MQAELQGKKRKIQMQMITKFNCPVLKCSPFFGVKIKKKMKSKKTEMKTVLGLI